jgi:murein L,D-transpeptidase YcbB/YkuD
LAAIIYVTGQVSAVHHLACFDRLSLAFGFSPGPVCRSLQTGLAEPHETRQAARLAKRAFLHMRAWTRFCTAAGVALAVIGGLSALAEPAAAQRSDWRRALGPSYGYDGPEPDDRAQIRAWEMNPKAGLPTLSPGNLGPMKAAIARYTGIAAKGGWRKLPNDAKLRQGDTDPAVTLLRARLVATGELQDTGSSDYFDYDLGQAVRRYQEANGLAPTGIVDKATLAALNVPAAARLKQLRANLARLTQLGKAPRKFIFVNIPAAQIEAIENDAVASRHAGIVGKVDRPTPLLKSSIQQLNFNAVWHLPPTVIKEDLIPTGRKMAKRGQSVLVKFKIDAYGGDGRKLDPTKVNWSTAQGLTFRQQPGPENPLGFVKLNFPNAHSVYMHDTPGKALFGRSFRAASSGCVRVSEIDKLAAWLAADQGWKAEQVRHMKDTRERYDLTLKHAVPLYFAYITAWATRDGAVHFRRDIYNKDGVGKQAATY